MPLNHNQTVEMVICIGVEECNKGQNVFVTTNLFDNMNEHDNGKT